MKGFERSWVEIDLDSFAHNLQQMKNRLSANTGFMQIVKADAYGHGAYEIALQSLQLGAVSLGVANAEEGALLRYQNIEAPILILSPSFQEEIELILENKLTPTVTTLDFAEALNSKSTMQKIKVHLEIDTGMGRSGIRYDNALSMINQIKMLPNLEIEGIFSHFSSSESDIGFTNLQNERFKKIIEQLDLPIKYIHIANSTAVITCSPEFANLVRIGLLSYGVYTDDDLCDKIDLLPVMSFKSAICQIKEAKKGETIGYNRTFTAVRDIRYAIIPVGYADGYDFLLSNRGKVIINGNLYPLLGRISMDMITVDVTDGQEIECGDEVTLLNSGDLRSEKIVALYEGLSYELLCQIGRRARRYYRQDGKIVATSPLSRREFVSHDFSDKKLNLIIESAISQRLQSKEIASLIYSEILRRFFVDKDQNIHYRKNFQHSIVFSIPREKNLENYYEVTTELTFTKILQQEYFYVACANRYEDLEKYFRRRDVEYRWLLDDKFSLTEDFFEVTNVSINDFPLSFQKEMRDGCMEIKCSHPELSGLVGNEVRFSISTKTYYPKKSQQLTVYITEITRGVKICFSYPDKEFEDIEVVSIVSGQSKYPIIDKQKDTLEVKTGEEEWIYPNSGVVFVYKK
ncbi:MAG: alanine racemase [Candidatus Cloacimonetes bacterium]|nr:alanine racemase [Candidatus Cloacimonadota bacterium]